MDLKDCFDELYNDMKKKQPQKISDGDIEYFIVQRIKKSVTGIVATDYWGAYECFVPEEIHVQSKAETFTVEGYNSLLWHFLARFRRKTKCYSKSVEMLQTSIKLLMLKRNGRLSFSE